MPNETVASRTFEILSHLQSGTMKVVEASFAQGLEDEVERLNKQLAHAKEQSALMVDSRRVLYDECDSLRQQVAMDTQRFKEMQEHGTKMEVEMDGLRQQLTQLAATERQLREALKPFLKPEWTTVEYQDALDDAKQALSLPPSDALKPWVALVKWARAIGVEISGENSGLVQNADQLLQSIGLE